MARNNSPSARWAREHGWSGFRRWQRRMKFAYANEGDARDQALLMDLKRGIAFNVYACRWGNDYRDGEVFAIHWHLGRPRESRGDDETGVDE